VVAVWWMRSKASVSSSAGVMRLDVSAGAGTDTARP
jgi:hypothetical protein